jgi:hypothetical protein
VEKFWSFRRHFGQILAHGRLRRQSQADPDRINLLQRLLDRCFVNLDCLPALVEVFFADALGREFLTPFEVGLGELQGCLLAFEVLHAGAQIGNLIVDVLDGMLELEPVGPRLGHQAAHLCLGSPQVRLGCHYRGLLDFDLNLVGFLVELDQQVPLFYAHVVIHQDPAHLAGNAGSQEGHVAIDVGVIGAHRVQCRDHPGHQEITRDRHADNGRRQEQPFSPRACWWRSFRWF